MTNHAADSDPPRVDPEAGDSLHVRLIWLGGPVFDDLEPETQAIGEAPGGLVYLDPRLIRALPYAVSTGDVIDARWLDRRERRVTPADSR